MPLPRLLVIEDDDAVRAAIVAALKNDFALVEARDVVEAFAELAEAVPDVVVLDLVLGSAPTARLHEALAKRVLPVLLVSGSDYTSLPKVAEERGWPFLAKPFTAESLRRNVLGLLPQPRASPTTPPPGRATKVPEAPAVEDDAPLPRARSLTPPDAMPAATGTRSERVEVVDMISRRLLRGFCAGVVGLLIYAFELRGHSVPGTAITAITLLGFGPDALVSALKKKPAVAGGGAAALVAFALAGDLADVHLLEMVAALGAGSLPVVDELTRMTRG